MVIFNEEKVKYEYLDLILLEKMSNIQFSSTVNVIVDVKEIFKKVFRPNVFPTRIPDLGLLTQEITSDIIGIISHYRNYFYKHGKYTTFYFIYSENECEKLKTVFPKYKKEHYEKYYSSDDEKSKIRSRSMTAVKKFVNALPNSYYIDSSEFEDVTVLKYLTGKIPENQFTLLLTNDPHWFQVLSGNVFALNCKGIKSQIISYKNSVEYIGKLMDTEITPALIPFILAISGSKKYSIPNIKGIGEVRATAILQQLIQSGKIQNTTYLNFPLKIEDLNPENKNEKILIDNFETLKRNFLMISCVDILYSNELNIMKLFNIAKPKLTENRLMDINAKLFTDFPINLEMLLKGEKL